MYRLCGTHLNCQRRDRRDHRHLTCSSPWGLRGRCSSRAAVPGSSSWSGTTVEEHPEEETWLQGYCCVQDSEPSPSAGPQGLQFWPAPWLLEVRTEPTHTPARFEVQVWGNCWNRDRRKAQTAFSFCLVLWTPSGPGQDRLCDVGPVWTWLQFGLS